MAIFKDVEISKQINVADPDNSLIRLTAVFAQKVMDETLETEINSVAKQVIARFLAEDEDIRNTIRDYVREAILTVPTEVIRDAMREIIREELGMVKGTYATSSASSAYMRCFSCGMYYDPTAGAHVCFALPGMYRTFKL